MTSGSKGLVIYKGKLLLVLRDNKSDIPWPNTWEYIGGGKELGESFEETGLREIEEEFGIRPKNYTFLGIENYPGRQAGRFIAILSDEEFQNIHFGNEGVKFNWFTLEEATKLEMAPNLKKFLEINKKPLIDIIENSRPIKKTDFIFTNES